jgi:hypothetical protein
MIDELEMIWKEMNLSWSMYCSCIFHEGLKESAKHLNQDNLYPGRDWNPASLEYESLELYGYFNVL